jgi:hypothetical protein
MVCCFFIQWTGRRYRSGLATSAIAAFLPDDMYKRNPSCNSFNSISTAPRTRAREAERALMAGEELGASRNSSF